MSDGKRVRKKRTNPARRRGGGGGNAAPGSKRGGRNRPSAKAVKKSLLAATAGGRNSVSQLFPSLAKGEGCGAMVIVAERAVGGMDQKTSLIERPVGLRPRKGGAGRGKPRIDRSAGAALSALGHPVRSRILEKLLEGPGTYRTLKRVTGLKAGPFYHHINQLRMARLLLPKERDLYELTRAGRNAVLVAQALGPLLRDTRRRPVG